MKNKHCEKVTIVIHTRNRPAFLLHLVAHYHRNLRDFGTKILVLDASSPPAFALIQQELECDWYRPTVELLHHEENHSLTERLRIGLARVETPYILMAADDDVYFFDWLRAGVELLDSDPTFGVVYGHELRFRLARPEPMQKVKWYDFPHRWVPPFRWLEDETPAERLKELGKSDWGTPGWYALQRTDLLRVIIDAAVSVGLRAYHFEKLVVVCQVALTKTRRLDEVFLARQVAHDVREPYSYRDEAPMLPRLEKLAVEVIVRHSELDEHTASDLVAKAFAPEIAELRRGDTRRIWRSLANAFPVLRKGKRALEMVRRRITSAPDPLQPDARFPLPPRACADNEFVRALQDFIEPPARTEEALRARSGEPR